MFNLYRCPPNFPIESASTTEASTTTGKQQHSKVAAKTGGAKYQWNILKSLGVADEEIPKFADTSYWLEYFPPKCRGDLDRFGLHVDWRRSFITTDANPFYDSFVRWQFNKLRAKNHIRFGKRYTIFSPRDGQPCMDHDRQSGEGVEPKEYICIKMRLDAPSPAFEAKFPQLSGRQVFLVAGTLRPETMYGQTNCWVGPEIEYGAFEAANGDNNNSHSPVYLCTARAAVNMSYQGILLAENCGSPVSLASIKGSDLIGEMVQAPLSEYGRVPVLPMMSILPGKGTGIVTSVPSNSPDDFAAWRDLRDKEAFRDKFGIAGSLLTDFVPVSIIESPQLGGFAAEKCCADLGIKSQNDRVALEKAKELCYKEDFYAGVMKKGPWTGEAVSDAKPKVREELLADGRAFVYYEPENLVVSRSGEECVVALCDQWFIAYGEPAWRAQVEKCLRGVLEVFSDEARNQFEATLAWMQQWACSRSFGLGSRLPWDPQFLIESLSDSTLYPAYYCVAHILQGGSLDGSVSPNGIRPEQMTDAVWDYVFGLSDTLQEVSEVSGIAEALLQRMHREFDYFYPVDLRVSGKDLIPNHLTFYLYNHVAIFPEKYWPRGIRANGHLLLNSQKMSKSTGNFMTLFEACDEFSADATRIALADAGDGLEDANFLKETANSAILRLSLLLDFAREVFGASEANNSSSLGLLRGCSVKCDISNGIDKCDISNGIDNCDISNDIDKCDINKCTFDSSMLWADRVFSAEIDKAIKLCDEAYERTNFREAIKAAFYELSNARDRYRDVTSLHGNCGMHLPLLKRFVQVQVLLLSPVASHICEYIWCQVIGKTEAVTSTIMKAAWPSMSEPCVNEALLASSAYVHDVAHDLRTTLASEMAMAAKKKSADSPAVPDAAELFVAVGYPAWQESAINILNSRYDRVARNFGADDALVAALKPLTAARANKKLIPFVMELKKKILAATNDAVIERLLTARPDSLARFGQPECNLLAENREYLLATLALNSLQITPVWGEDFDEDSPALADPAIKRKIELANPGAPTARFYKE
jgi:leucyl-tRNA synthetase